MKKLLLSVALIGGVAFASAKNDLKSSSTKEITKKEVTSSFSTSTNITSQNFLPPGTCTQIDVELTAVTVMDDGGGSHTEYVTTCSSAISYPCTGGGTTVNITIN